MASDITVTAENYGGHPDDGPNVIVVCVGGVEVGAYCIVDHPEQERLAMLRMATAVRDAGAESMQERAAAVLRDPEARHSYVLLGPRVIMHCANLINTLPLTEPDDV